MGMGGNTGSVLVRVSVLVSVRTDSVPNGSDLLVPVPFNGLFLQQCLPWFESFVTQGRQFNRN